MTKYLVLYRAPVGAFEQMANTTPEQAQAGMELWMTWAGKAGDHLVDLGSPLASVSTVGKASSGGSAIGGFSILQADTVEDVNTLLKDHPHFHASPDASIEVLEFLPVPGM
jgi:hypothetical protein